jgi:4-amino-4-deoxy-L-arabinose transferase-like glycosyltransferase
MSIDRLVNQKSIFSIVIIIILFALSYFSIFNNLGKFQIRMWDEATYANNSIDMLLSNKSIFVVEHQGKPDLYNTKPPFVIWLQALSMKALGINEFAIRLPSAIFGLLTVLLVYFFCALVLGSKIIGFLSSAVLLTVKGYVGNHVVRTGDLDAVLVFWLTLGLFAFIDLVIKKPRNSFYHFLILTISFTCGFLTKGIAGFFFIHCMVMILFLFNNHKILKEKSLYIAGFITVFFCSSYYFIREFLTPGYINLVLGSEILRYNHEVMSWHVHPFDFYYQNLKTNRFNPFFYILPITLLNPFILKSHKLQTSIYLTIAAVGYFLLISYPAVKLEWYDAPLFPVLSVLIGVSFVETGIFIFNKLNIGWNLFLIEIFLAGVAVLFLFKPYKDIIANTKYPEEQIYSMEFDGAYLKYLEKNRPDIKYFTVFKKENHEEHYDQVLFYIRAYEQQNNHHIKLTQEMNFKKDEIVMICKQLDKVSIQKDYLVEEIDTWQTGTLYRIKDKILK